MSVRLSHVNPKIVFAPLFLLFLEFFFIFQLQDKSKSSINFKFSSDVKHFSDLFHFYGTTATSCSCTCVDKNIKCIYTPLNAIRNKQKTLEAQTIYKLKSRDPQSGRVCDTQTARTQECHNYSLGLLEQRFSGSVSVSSLQQKSDRL